MSRHIMTTAVGDEVLAELNKLADVGGLNGFEGPNHQYGKVNPYFLPSSGLGSFEGYGGWTGRGTLSLGYDGIPDIGYFSAEGFAGRRSYRQRAKSRRHERRQRSKRRLKNWCRKHKKFCHFWDKNWSKILRIINLIGGAIATCIPFVGAIVGPALAAVGEAGIRAGEAAYKCANKKGEKKCGKKAMKALGQGLAEGALDTIGNVAGKYGKNVKLSPEATKKFETILKKPEVKKLKELYEKVEKATGPVRKKIEAEIDKIDDKVQPELEDFEQEVDELYWAKGGWTKEWKEDEVTIRVDKKGDKWGMWDPEAKEQAPEGVRPGIWFRITGKSAIQEAEEELGDTENSALTGKGVAAGKALEVAHDTGKEAADVLQKIPSGQVTSKTPKPRQLGAAERVAYLKAHPEVQAQAQDRPLWRVGSIVLAADTAEAAQGKLAYSAASGKVPQSMMDKLGFSSLGITKTHLVVGGVAVVALVGAYLVLSRRGGNVVVVKQ